MTKLERVTSHVVIRGRYPNEFVSEFKKQTQSTTYNASRLLVTESARVQAKSQKLTYLKDLGEDGEYKYVAKIDKKTSKLCHSLNGKVFKVKDMVPGVNAPPMHPWCRSTTVPHVGNWRDKFFKERKGNYKYAKPNQYSQKVEQWKAGKKVKITEQAIDKVKLVNIPGHTEDENKRILKKHKELLKDAKDKNNSNEVVYLIKGDMEIKVFGDQTSVDLNPGSEASNLLLNSKLKSVTMLHNHPGSSIFSLTDLALLISTDSLKTMTIVTNRGQVKYISKTENFSKSKAIQITKPIVKAMEKGKFTSDLIEKMLKLLYNAGEIHYKVR